MRLYHLLSTIGKRVTLFALSSALLGIFISVALGTQANALSASDFKAGNIIDNGVFFNDTSMSVADIQNFLNAKVPTCDTNGSASKSYYYNPSTHYVGSSSVSGSSYVTTTRAIYGQRYDTYNGTSKAAAPYICLKNYVENPSTHQNNLQNPSASISGGQSAAQIIYNAAHTYSINPQVLLVTLQKEQGLITDDWPWTNEYQIAMGYACPDTAPCDTQYYGFANQVNSAAAQFRRYYNNPNNYNYVVGTEYIQYNTSASCGGTSVNVQNQATANLYNYTPYQPNPAALSGISATNPGGGDSCSAYGNRNFWWYFTTWFGSTHYNEPPSSMLLSDNQTGRLYFINTQDSTRYYVPTWSTLQAYGLDRYQVIPSDDSIVTGYTDKGTLKTLVFNNDDQKVYLVDNGKRYWFDQYCSEWGLDCLNSTPGDVTFLSSNYFDGLAYGGTSQPLQYYRSNYYLMKDGKKEPFANLSSLQSEGYTPNQAIGINQDDINSPQPLGVLHLGTPTFIQFSPNPQLFYFDGQQYHYVNSYTTYQAWGSRPILTPPTSSYNTTVPTSSGDLVLWAKDASNHYFLIDGAHKIDITNDASNWFSGPFATYMNQLLNTLTTVQSKQNVNISGNIYTVQNAQKRHIPTYDDYLWLGINASNTLALSQAANTTIPTGPEMLRDGAFFTVQNDPGLYITNGTASYHVPSADIAGDLGIDWGAIRQNLSPITLSQGYPTSGDLTRWLKPYQSGLSYLATGSLLSISDGTASNWGINTSNHVASNIDLAPLFGVASHQNLGQFVKDSTTGRVYYASDGIYHFVASYNTLVGLGGTRAPIPNVYPNFFTGLTQGNTLN